MDYFAGLDISMAGAGAGVLDREGAVCFARPHISAGPPSPGAGVGDEWPAALLVLATLLDSSAIVELEFSESVRKMRDDRQYAPATLRNRGSILDVLRDVPPMTGVIPEIASGSGEHVVNFAMNFPAIVFSGFIRLAVLRLRGSAG